MGTKFTEPGNNALRYAMSGDSRYVIHRAFLPMHMLPGAGPVEVALRLAMGIDSWSYPCGCVQDEHGICRCEEHGGEKDPLRDD